MVKINTCVKQIKNDIFKEILDDKTKRKNLERKNLVNEIFENIL